MTAIDIARTGYARTQTTTRSPRDTEYATFERVTAALRNAARPGAAFIAMAEAIHRNRQLWTHVAAAVADADNALPSDLRARLFYLAEFTHAHSAEVLAGRDAADPLIDINIAVMRGLDGRPEAS